MSIHTFETELAALQAAGLYRQRRPLERLTSTRVRLDGREILHFASNDYLGLARHPALIQAAQRVACRYGTGATSSPLIVGHLPPLRQLERDLARHYGYPAAVVFPCGYSTNIGTIPALVSAGDVIFSDALNHACLIDGARLSRATVHVYRHADISHLENLLKQHASAARRRLILTDGVFSMDGDIAPLAELLVLAEKFDALLLVDEAHRLGAAGQCPSPRMIYVGTLSKALGSQGGFVCADEVIIDWLVNRGRSYVFSTALAPPAAAAARAALRLAAKMDREREHLGRLSEYLRRQLREIGFPPTGSQTQIVPIVVGDAGAAIQLSQHLLNQGILVPAIRPPTVPLGSSRLRISLTVEHTQADVDRLLAGLCPRHFPFKRVE